MKKLLGISAIAALAVLPMAANATPTYASAIPMDPVDATANTNIASTSFVRGAYNAAVAVANKENERALAAEGDLTLGGTAADWNGADDLTEAVNAAMDKARAAANAAGNAVQSVAEGSTNGTVSVDGTDVAVHGLGSAAYTDSTAYDASGTAAGLVGTLSNLDTTDKSNVVAAINELKTATDDLADSENIDYDNTDSGLTATNVQAAIDEIAGTAGSAVQSVAEGSTNGTVSVDGTDVAVHGLGSAAYTDSTAYDASGTAAGLVGTLSNLDTTDKSNVVAAINELAGAIDDQGDKVLKVYTTWNTDVYGEVQLGDSDPYVANPNP